MVPAKNQVRPAMRARHSDLAHALLEFRDSRGARGGGCRTASYRTDERRAVGEH